MSGPPSPGSTRRRLCLAGLLTVCLALPPIAGAQTVLLQIRPRAGDTLHMRLDQESEMTGIRRPSAGQKGAQNLPPVVTTLRLFSRAVVETTTAVGSTVLAITDSVSMTTSDARARALADETRRMLQGKQILLRLGTDGVVSMTRGSAGAEGWPAGGGDLSETMSAMPAAFPHRPVRVGERWTRDMQLPAADHLGAGGGSELHAVFRLDSLSHGGDRAYVSMHGDIRPLRAGHSTPAIGPLLQGGTVSGALLLDRRRGWLTESHFVIVVHSELIPSAATNIPPLRFRMKITQRTRTLDKR